MKNEVRGRPRAWQFLSAMKLCLALSYKASAFYTWIRIICSTVPSVISLLQTFVAKYILDLLAGAYISDNLYKSIIILFGAELFLALMGTIIQKLNFYLQSVHGELVQNKIVEFLMNKALHADLELFDSL